MIGVTSILSSFMHLSLPVALCACPEEPEPLRPAACVRLHVKRPVRGELPALRAEPGPEPRTLPMKTWRLRLRASDGRNATLSQAIARYLACWIGPTLAVGAFAALNPLEYGRWALALLPFNYAWALVDRDRQFLQDRIAGTRLLVEARQRG